MNDTFMKEKPVLPLILSMSLPMVLSMLVNSLYNIVDSFFVAQISEEAMTALSLVYPVQNFINAAGIGFGVGINAVIAFYLGAGDHRKADQAATQGLVLAVIHGIVMTVCCRNGKIFYTSITSLSHISKNTADKSIYNHAPRGLLPRGAFSMYAPQEACGVVFNAKAIVPCRGFCVLALAFASCPPPEAGAGASARSPSEAALPVLFRRVFLFP